MEDVADDGPEIMIMIKLIHRDIYIFFRFLASFGSISSIQSERFFFFMQVDRRTKERQRQKRQAQDYYCFMKRFAVCERIADKLGLAHFIIIVFRGP